MKRPFICITSGFALGITLAHAFTDKDTTPAALACIAAALICLGLLLCTTMTRAAKIRSLLFIFLALLCGGGRLLLEFHTLSHNDSLNALCTGTEGVTDAEISAISIKGERLTLRCDDLIVYYTPARDEESPWYTGGSSWYENTDNFSDTSSASSEELSRIFSIGNRIRITGEFSEMDKPRNPGEFNYYLYYLADGVTHRCFADSIEVIDDHVNTIPDTIFRIRRELLRRIDVIYNDDDAGVLRAVLLGDKTELNEDINDLYRKNGIAHLLAISGLHVGIIGMSLYNLLRKRLKLSYAVCGIVCGAWLLFYCLLTGAGVSTIRATIMMLLTFLAGILGMHYDMLSGAGIAALIILIIHPYQLFNCTFLLSFGCIVAIAGPATFIMNELKLKNSILKSLIMSLTIQFFTLPITAYFFFEVSPYGCLLNLIVIPLMTFVVWSSLISVLISFIWPMAALILSYVSHFILSFYTWLGGIAIKLPCSSILIGRPSLWQSFVYYLLFFLVLYSSQLKVLIPPSLLSTSDRETGSASMPAKTSS